MGNGVRKTVTEKQLAVYGGFQSTLRKMSPAEHDKYAPNGTPGYQRHQALLAAQDSRRQYRAQAIKEFESRVPQWGRFAGTTPEAREQEVIQRTQTAHEWHARRKLFMDRLDADYPAIIM